MKKTLFTLGVASLALVFPLLGEGNASPFEVTYSFDGGLIQGHTPVPQRDGFDYFFTPLKVKLKQSIRGKEARISNIKVKSFGENNGSAINFDWEVFLGPAPFGLPEGQFLKTLVDPVTGYSRQASTQFRFVIGSQLDTQDYLFSGEYDFLSETATANPFLANVKVASTVPMDLKDGLYAQMFLWTADNRNVDIHFRDIKLVVQGDIAKRHTKPSKSVPEPATLAMFCAGLAGIGFFRKKISWP